MYIVAAIMAYSASNLNGLSVVGHSRRRPRTDRQDRRHQTPRAPHHSCR